MTKNQDTKIFWIYLLSINMRRLTKCIHSFSPDHYYYMCSYELVCSDIMIMLHSSTGHILWRDGRILNVVLIKTCYSHHLHIQHTEQHQRSCGGVCVWVLCCLLCCWFTPSSSVLCPPAGLHDEEVVTWWQAVVMNHLEGRVKKKITSTNQKQITMIYYYWNQCWFLNGKYSLISDMMLMLWTC